MKKIFKVCLLAAAAVCLLGCANPDEGGGKKGNTWTVQFMLNNGTEDVYKTVTVENNKTVTAPSDPTRNGYTFEGWFVDKDCNVYFDEGSEKIIADTKLYASWVSSGITNPDTGGENTSSENGSSEEESNGGQVELPAGATEEAPTSGYALLITTVNGDIYYYPLTPGEEFEGFSQHVGLGVTFNEGDQIHLFDGTSQVSWIEDNLNSYSIEGFRASVTEGIVCETSGTYDVYAKFKYGEDEVYIGPAQ